MTRLLVIGGSGFVGAELVARAAGRFQVAAPPSKKLDLNDGASVRRGLAETRPDVVALVAAMADIDVCERESDRAWRVNVEGARLVAEACALQDARLVYTSSAAVYDGTRERYVESDPPTPVSVYGRTKAEAERVIAAHLPRAVMVRPALVVGRARTAGTNSFQDKLVRWLQAGETVNAPVFEYRNPIDVGTLAESILRLVENPEAEGVYHIGATEGVTRYELACRYAALTGASQSRIIPQTEPPAGRAARGLRHFLVSTRIEEATRLAMPSIDKVLERALHGFAESGI